MVLFQLLRKLFEDGGWVIWPIMGVSILGLSIGLRKTVQLSGINRARKKFYKALYGAGTTGVKSTGFLPYDTLLGRMQKSSADNKQYIPRHIQEFVIQVMPSLDGGLSTMSTCVSVAPLLGLLGTITGMNKMFDIIYEFGLGSPTLMAEGISIALEAALTGLTVAVVVMFFHNFLLNRKEVLVSRIYKDAEELTSARFLSRAGREG
jgi:biopolymer transport protein ExbB